MSYKSDLWIFMIFIILLSFCGGDDPSKCPPCRKDEACVEEYRKTGPAGLTVPTGIWECKKK